MSVARFWYSVAVVSICLIAGVIGNAIYTNREVTKSNQEWCELLTTLDSPLPPTRRDPRTEEIAGKLRNLRIRFGC